MRPSVSEIRQVTILVTPIKLSLIHSDVIGRMVERRNVAACAATREVRTRSIRSEYRGASPRAGQFGPDALARRLRLLATLAEANTDCIAGLPSGTMMEEQAVR